ncbi:hypothetical protein ACOBR2_20840 [Telmatobacter bradus]|uniref:hypothetical protein n=1 Tax=Telmatobacter bradus TaxID=474953 RepID=UPI003B43D3EB
MNFSQMHDRLRLELLRRIQRGSLSVSLLARQTGLGQPHLSNFLHDRRQLSMDAMDRIMAAQHLTALDLLPPVRHPELAEAELEHSTVPIVPHSTALFEPFIRPGSVQSMLHVPAGLLQSLHARASHTRRTWQRFVAVRISAADALAMQPLLLAEAIVLIDRHYNSLAPYRPNRPNLYAVRQGTQLLVRYVEFVSGRLLLRPQNLEAALELLETAPDEAPNEYLVGRIILILNTF